MYVGSSLQVARSIFSCRCTLNCFFPFGIVLNSFGELVENEETSTKVMRKFHVFLVRRRCLSCAKEHATMSPTEINLVQFHENIHILRKRSTLDIIYAYYQKEDECDCDNKIVFETNYCISRYWYA